MKIDRLMKRTTLFCALLVAASSPALDIVKDGQPVAEIVLAKDANRSEQLAAEDIQTFIEQISGAKLAVGEKPSGKVKNVIYVGENEFTKKLGFDLDAVENGGYRLLVADDYAIVAGRDRLGKVNCAGKRDPKALAKWRKFAGEDFRMPSALRASKEGQAALGIFKNDDTGTWYAASELLEQLGVRFYHPYENGTIVPKSKNVSLRKQDLVKIPRAQYREFYAYHASACPDFIKWTHRNKYGVSTMIVDNHTTREILSEEIQLKYPRVMARDKNGELVRGRGAPKLTDPKFRELSMKFLRKVFDYNPQITAMALGMPDGLVAIDDEDSLKFPVEGKEKWGRFSDYVWDYWSWAANELKKTHPDKYLTCLAYAGYSELPSDPKMIPDNVFITYCYATMRLRDDYVAKPIVARRQQWFDLLGDKRVRIWDYMFYGRHRPPVPLFFFKLLQEDTRALDGNYLGKFIEGASDFKTKRMKYPGLWHFTLYWQGKLFWDPEADLEKTMDEYLKLYFGPAENEMREFYEYSERQFMNPDPKLKLDAERLRKRNDKYFEILARAREKAGKGTVFDQRIAEIESEISPIKKMHESLLRHGETIRIPRFKNDTPLDGDLGKYGAKRFCKNLATGEEIANNPTRVAAAVSEDNSTLYVIVECADSDMNNLKADCDKDDHYSIYDDDVVEVYVETPKAKFFKIVVNPNGAVYDETTDPTLVERDTLPLLWQSGVKKLVRQTKDAWIVELAIPTKDFGDLGPSKDFPWGLQVGRTRHSRSRLSNQALCPTGGRFDLTTKWANIWSVKK